MLMHGILSAMYWHTINQEVENQAGKPKKKVNFRDKGKK